MNESDLGRPTATIAPDELARVFGDPEGVARLVASGVIVKDEQGRVPLVAGIQAYINGLRAELRSGSATASAERARAARANAAELALMERRRELIAAADAEAGTDHLAAAVRLAFTGLAPRVTRDLSARRKVEDMADKALATIARDLGTSTT